MRNLAIFTCQNKSEYSEKVVLHLSDASRYEGEWRDNKIFGEGMLVFWDGKRYKGSWEGDKFNGHFDV